MKREKKGKKRTEKREGKKRRERRKGRKKKEWSDRRDLIQPRDIFEI